MGNGLPGPDGCHRPDPLRFRSVPWAFDGAERCHHDPPDTTYDGQAEIIFLASLLISTLRALAFSASGTRTVSTPFS